jgi:hypothetical protein
MCFKNIYDFFLHKIWSLYIVLNHSQSNYTNHMSCPLDRACTLGNVFVLIILKHRHWLCKYFLILLQMVSSQCPLSKCVLSLCRIANCQFIRTIRKIRWTLVRQNRLLQLKKPYHLFVSNLFEWIVFCSNYKQVSIYVVMPCHLILGGRAYIFHMKI